MAKRKAVKNQTRKTPRAPSSVHPDVQNEIDLQTKNAVKNGLSQAIFGLNIQSIGEQISQADTLFKNNRWYMISNMRQLISEMYVEHGLVQTVVNVPVDDGLRGGIKVVSQQMSEEEIQQLEACVEREGDLIVAGQAAKWNRLYGGAGIVVITEQDPETPLDIKALTSESKLEFRAVDMWELFWSRQNTMDYSAVIDADEMQNVSHYNYYGVRLDSSRVMPLKGLTAPSFIRPRLRGWGFSILESLVRSINQYLKTTTLVFEVLDEFKIDIYKIKNLANTLIQANGTDQVRKRIQLANQEKNFQRAITMDSEDDYITKELSFSGIGETMQGIRMQIASDLRMPLTKIFGISATGFNSGQDDIENYNAMVESEIRAKLKFDIIKMLSFRCQQMFGYVPDDLTIEFPPLRIMTAEQEENVKTQKFGRLLQAKQAALITDKEFKEACNSDKLLPITLDILETDDLDIAESETPRHEPAYITAPAGGKSIEPSEPKGASEAKTNSIQNPGKVDEGLWKKAKEISMKAFGKLKWAFITSEYEKLGGEFHKATNESSIEFLKAEYEALGGDDHIGDYHKRQYDNPDKGELSLWARAKEATLKAYGREHWKFAYWWYKEHGGKSH